MSFSSSIHFKLTLRGTVDAPQWNMFCFISCSDVNLITAAITFRIIKWILVMSDFDANVKAAIILHTLPRNKCQPDGQVDPLFPCTSTFTSANPTALYTRVSFWIGLEIRSCVWVTANGTAARSGIKTAIQTDWGSRSESAMSKHKHGWVGNESEERCHTASCGLRRQSPTSLDENY